MHRSSVYSSVVLPFGERARVMNVTVYIPSPLREYAGGASSLVLAAATVRSALAQIERTHPTLYRSICDETDSVRRHVNLFVNSSHIRDLEQLETALASGDTITIVPAVSGG